MNPRHILPAALVGTISTFSALAFTAPALAEAPAQVSAGKVNVPAGTYELDPTHAALLWSFRHNGISNYTGRFEKVSATLKLDPAKLSESSITFTADPRSVQVAFPADYKAMHKDSPYGSFAEDISRNPAYLNADKFPQISFTSTKVEPTSATTADVTGNLTFLGVTRPVTMKATFLGEIESHPFLKVPAVGFAAEGTFKRSDFGQAENYVGDVVTIRFDGEFVQQVEKK
ncbi:YceI family protein [Xanthobacter sp. TB0136]|uniref:YceI family protein n=1 Tax=Xanthobacter sp. TB0136 TaxID=3459177 RepID=UPI004039BC20